MKVSSMVQVFRRCYMRVRSGEDGGVRVDRGLDLPLPFYLPFPRRYSLYFVIRPVGLETLIYLIVRLQLGLDLPVHLLEWTLERWHRIIDGDWTIIHLLWAILGHTERICIRIALHHCVA